MPALVTTDPRLPVLVVGAGPAGLAAMAALKRDGVAFEGIESHGGVGGIWDEGNPISSAYLGMHTAASRATTYLLRPMPNDWPHFVPLRLAWQYLNDFAEDQGLNPHIRFGTRFLGAEKTSGGTWVAALRPNTAGETDRREFRAIVFATGSHNLDHAAFDRSLLDDATANGMRAIHSAEYRGPSAFAGRRVLIIGVGASGTDIAAKLCDAAEQTILSVRTDPWIIPDAVLKWVPLLAKLGVAPDRLAADTRWIPNQVRTGAFSAIVRLAIGDLRRFGLAPPQHRLFDRVPVLDRGIVHAIRAGRVVVRSAVTGFGHGVVRFATHADEPIDDVIFATGFFRHYPLLPQVNGGATRENIPSFYLFHANEPGLAYMTEVIGAGSCWPIFVEQGRAIAAYFAAEQRGGRNVAALNMRRSVVTPSFKGKLFARADMFHIDYALYTRALRRLVAWLEA